MNLMIYINGHYEEEKALVDLDTEKVIIKGDYYHDKIDYRIEGYIAALEDFEIYSDEVQEREIHSDHYMYKRLGFYNEEEDD